MLRLELPSTTTDRSVSKAILKSLIPRGRPVWLRGTHHHQPLPLRPSANKPSAMARIRLPFADIVSAVNFPTHNRSVSPADIAFVRLSSR